MQEFHKSDGPNFNYIIKKLMGSTDLATINS